MRASYDQTLRQQMDAEVAAFRESTYTSDFAEGIAAFGDKRRPRFVGR